MSFPSWISRDRLVILMIVLSASTGMVDAVSVLGLGKVFTANMTGNIVFLGFAAVGTPGFTASLYITGLACFGVGALLAGRLNKSCLQHSRRRWLLYAALVETSLLWLAALVALCTAHPVSDMVTSGAVYTIIALSAGAMGSRNATVRQLKVADLTTTVLTLTITGLAADAGVGDGSNPHLGRRVAAIIAILIGAMAGAALLRLAGLAPPLFLAGLCTLLATLVLAKDVSPAA